MIVDYLLLITVIAAAPWRLANSHGPNNQ